MRRGLAAALLGLAACATPPAAPPVSNIVFQNHADPSIDAAKVVAIGQRQYDFLKAYVGSAPDRVIVHCGRDYACGHAVPSTPDPELFLQDFGVLDPSNNWAHEMMHCFMFRYGLLPHWFNESISDVAYLDSEADLWKHSTVEKTVKAWKFDRIDNRSYELMKLRLRYGREFFPKVTRIMERELATCRATFQPGQELETQNLLLLKIMSEAAGENLAPLFVDEWGFNPKTRERQRGY